MAPSECAGAGADNLMFWGSEGGDNRSLTEAQDRVLRRSLLLH